MYITNTEMLTRHADMYLRVVTTSNERQPVFNDLYILPLDFQSFSSWILTKKTCLCSFQSVFSDELV